MAKRTGPTPVRLLRPAIGSVGFALAFGLAYTIFIRTSAGQALDASSFGAVSTSDVIVHLTNIYRVAAPIALIVACVVVGVWSLIHRRVVGVVIGAAIVLVSALLCEALKDVLSRPDLGANGYTDNTFPSGHVSLALSSAVALAVMIPASGWRRRSIVIADLAALAVSWASVVSFAHRPSDVIGASLVVGLVTSLLLWGKQTVTHGHPAFAVAPIVAILLGYALVIVGGPVDTLGWFLLCVMPGVLALGAAPASVAARSTPSRPSATQRP